jgi:retron-type reverse transcriptase
LTTDENGLPQGAPTSPRLSNLVNYILDVRLTRLARRWKGQYTRYADDITFSFPKDYPRHVRGVIQKTRRILKGLGYTLNHSKIRILRAHQRQTVTGLVVNDRVRISRRQRRLLRAVEHHLRTGRDATLTASQLEGWQAFIRMVDDADESPLPSE